MAIGPTDRYVVMIRGQTAQKRLQDALVQAQKMETVGVLVSGIAHELNNPIASIVLEAELLQRDPRLPDHLREETTHLLEEADRARRIVETFLEFIRPRPPERFPSPVLPLLEAVRGLQSFAQRDGIEWTIEVEPELPLIPIDRSQVQQVLLSLTTNAIQAMLADRPTGRLELAAMRGPSVHGRDTVRIVVTDDGPGIPDENLGSLFVPFFTTKQPGQGTGLGLTVSLDIVRRHDGRLLYEPAPSGRGAQFVIDLPTTASGDLGRSAGGRKRAVRQPPVSRETPSLGRPTGARPPRVLVLDDEPAIRKFIGTALTRAGYDVIVVTDGPTAIAQGGRQSIDVVLVDHRLAGMSGIEVYDALVALRPSLAHRWVFMSGDVLDPTLLGLVESHGIRLLAKPFDLATVVSTVGEVVRGAGLTQRG